MRGDPTSYFLSGESLRSRGVGERVLAGTVDLPPLPERLLADWRREAREELGMEPGDVEVMRLARARVRWPGLRECQAAAGAWLASQGLDARLLEDADMALMACLGARFHHDGAQYGHAAFFNLFVGEDRGLDLLFALGGQRIPLVRGTAVVFDTCQPHAVVPRGASAFDAAAFLPEHDWLQFFLTWELPVEEPALAGALGIAFDVDPEVAAVPHEQLRVHGRPAEPCPASGRWLGGF
ncbi:hypothetical protein GT347_16800 [Xylophilus rhododendri]|uniref:Aspartyl/asparaginy/proline hydroxylase domain-containing protein n=1 Tax=Xylophilus rhododendri TaxID=2697032 RepID=A0A857J9R9_9BURK|nr:hypothetical protein [Xylophilus rhododendri]QHI99488.1 hypothetical protein GT347_16800 [Xylophilus rhododendri]